MKEIKFEYNEVDRVVKDMTVASNLLNPLFPKDVAQSCELDVIKKMEQINIMLEKIILDYKKVLNQSVVMVEDSVDTMKATDETLKTFMTLRSPLEGKK